MPINRSGKALNKWVLIWPDGVTVTGLCLADTREDAEDWADELGLEGEIIDRETFETTHPAGIQARAERTAYEQSPERLARRQAAAALEEKSKELKAKRQREREGT